MNKGLGLFVIGLVFGSGLGFTIAAGNGISFDGHDHTDPAHHEGMAMDHGGSGHDMAHATPINVPALNAPDLTIALTPDRMEGYNLRVNLSNFTFSPEGASLADVPGEGHAHVYVNGEKLGRLYGEWMHIAHLPKGEAVVSVTLNSNMHSPLAVNGQPISATTQITVE